VHAAVGLHPNQRERIEKLLLARLLDPKTNASMREDCIVIGVALDNWRPEFADLAGRQALDALAKTTDPFAQAVLAQAVAALAARLGPNEAARQARAVARQALEAVAKANSPVGVHDLRWPRRPINSTFSGSAALGWRRWRFGWGPKRRW
jgi:hypothetical protein